MAEHLSGKPEQCEAAAAFFGVKALRDVSITEFLEAADQLDPLTQRRAKHVITENLRTLNAAKAMQNADAALLGQLMNESHVSMRDDFEITNDELNVMVASPLSHATFQTQVWSLPYSPVKSMAPPLAS